MKEGRGGGEGEGRKRLQTNPPPGSEQRRAIFICQRMRWFPGMFCHAGPSSLVFFLFFCGMIKILSDSDFQIQISKNGLHLKLKLHQLWRTIL